MAKDEFSAFTSLSGDAVPDPDAVSSAGVAAQSKSFIIRTHYPRSILRTNRALN